MNKRTVELTPFYAVTAKHVIDGLRNAGVQETVIRMNLKEGDPPLGVARVPMDSWFCHPIDSTIDVSIHRMGIPSQVDHLALPMGLFMTPERMEENEVSLGDEVFTVGMFRHHVGQGKNIPIVRTGNLAALDEERVATRDFGDMSAYLIEARSIGGLSGSPVILNLGFVRLIDGQVKHSNSGSPLFYLLGLIHGHYDVPETLLDDGVALSNEKINTGIAIVSPYYSLMSVMSAFEAQ